MAKYLVCERCGVSREVAEFKRRVRDGKVSYSGLCFSCREKSMPAQKECSRCLSVKNVSDFSRNRNSKDCLQAYCKECSRGYYHTETKHKTSYQEKSKEYREKTKEQRTQYNRKRYAEKSEELIAYSKEYYLKVKDTSEHKAKVQAWAKKYKEENPEKLKETKAAWKKRNPHQAIKDYHKRKANLLGVPSDEDLSITTLRERDGDCCFYCGVVLDFTQYRRSKGEKMPLNQATHEHLIPLSKGGHNAFWNSVLACLSCNTSKGNKTVKEYVIWLESAV